MKSSTRQFYGSVALLLIWISGVFGGIVMAGHVNWGIVGFEWSLLVPALAFGWAATKE